MAVRVVRRYVAAAPWTRGWAMTDALKVVSDIRRELDAIDRRIRDHPYPGALERHEVSLDALKAFPGHQYHIVSSDLRSLATLVSRFGDDPARDFLLGVLDGERYGLAALVVMAKRLGMTEQELEHYEVSATGFAYATFMAWQALQATAAEFVAGILVNFPAWGHNCGRVSAALRRSYGFTAEDTAFLDAFATMPPFDDAVLPIIQQGLDRGGLAPGRLHRSARLFQAYELMFWDAVAKGR